MQGVLFANVSPVPDSTYKSETCWLGHKHNQDKYLTNCVLNS